MLPPTETKEIHDDFFYSGAQTGKIDFYNLGCFILLEPIEHYLLPCEILALESLTVKNGNKNKMQA